MIILAMVSAKPFESKFTWTVSHSHFSLLLDTRNWTYLLPRTCTNLLHCLSLDNKNVND